MIDLEIQTNVQVHEQVQMPEYATCRECARSFRPKCEDQLSVELCDQCFDALRQPVASLPTVRVKVLPRRAATAR